MVDVNLDPPIQNILNLPAGDSYDADITFKDDPDYAAGCTWTGQIRHTRVGMVDGEFEITPIPNGAHIHLSPEASQALGDTASPVLRASGAVTSIILYSAEYDIQIARPDFCKTLQQGVITIKLDVSRDTP